MRSALLGAFALLLASTSAHALVADGITYTLTENSISANGLTASFTFTASGENTASDTEGGRTGINAIAFNQPARHGDHGADDLAFGLHLCAGRSEQQRVRHHR